MLICTSWNSFPNSGDSSRLIEELLEDNALSKPLSPSLTFLFLIRDSIDFRMTLIAKYFWVVQGGTGDIFGGISLFGIWIFRF